MYVARIESMGIVPAKSGRPCLEATSMPLHPLWGSQTSQKDPPYPSRNPIKTNEAYGNQDTRQNIMKLVRTAQNIVQSLGTATGTNS